MEVICPENFEELELEPLEGDFVLVQYVIDGKRQTFYIGEVMVSRDDDDSCNIMGFYPRLILISTRKLNKLQRNSIKNSLNTVRQYLSIQHFYSGFTVSLP
jgi:hypothetical protein